MIEQSYLQEKINKIIYHNNEMFNRLNNPVIQEGINEKVKGIFLYNNIKLKDIN